MRQVRGNVLDGTVTDHPDDDAVDAANARLHEHVNNLRTWITEHYGERCAELEPECVCCRAWAALDALVQELEIP